jgi:hypothetical protein
MEYLTQLERIIESGHRLITVESDEVDRVCDLLLELSRLSTKPYYIAQPEQAMYRMGVSHIGIPRTQTANGLIEHIEASKHFGIFILSRYTAIFESDERVKKLIHIATADTHKIIIMVAENIILPRKLAPFAVRSKHKMKNTG